MLHVTVYDKDGSEEWDDIDYVSLVSPETYGPPALIAPARDGVARARVGETVLYINTRLVPVYKIERVSD